MTCVSECVLCMWEGGRREREREREREKEGWMGGGGGGGGGGEVCSVYIENYSK